MKSDYCIFILTHGRPNKQITINTLQRQGYTGEYYLIIDDEDSTADEYYRRYGEKVIQFKKKEIALTFDKANNFDDLRSITCARNACFEIAKTLGYTYFIELDDDYTYFNYKFNSRSQYTNVPVKTLDEIFQIYFEFFKTIPALTIATAQQGDFIGGEATTTFKIERGLFSPKRKAMNCFFLSTDRPFQFIGIFNEDVNTYTTLGQRGKLFLTIPFISLNQRETQTNSGGITELYKKFGTYVKSFTTVMMNPSSVDIFMMGYEGSKRIHHRINWKYTIPCILQEKYKKANSRF